jgi:cyclopropane fatty-acyl-phospholipid synthase-like methyltransferase
MAGRSLVHLLQHPTVLARKATMVAALRSALRHDPSRRLDVLYRWRDPWDMSSEREQHRFRATNALLQDIYGPIGSLLEVGCGEGHHSRHLAAVCDDLTGIDVSARAVRRATSGLPGATFTAGTIATQPWRAEAGRFDVVVACEVLYYVQDLDRLLADLECVSRRGVFVTCYAEGMDLVRDAVDSRADVQQAAFRFDDQVWEAAWWPVPRP